MSVEIHREAVYEVLSLQKYDGLPAFLSLNVDLSNSRQLVPKAKRISSHIESSPCRRLICKRIKPKPNNYTKGIHIIIK